MLYTFGKNLCRIGLRAYFKKIYITGAENIPFDKPILFAANHTNGLVDPVLIATSIPKAAHFLTRSDVFIPATEGIFKRLNMYPIYRIKDGYHLLSRNDATFEKCFNVLKENGNIIIFSEGDCEAHKQLRSLKKGTARMAFQALEDFDLDVHILPTTLNYTNHTDFRSDVMIHFGEAFSVKEFDEIREKNKARGIKAFNKKLNGELKKHLVHIDDLENEEALNQLLEVKRAEFISPATPLFAKNDKQRMVKEKEVADFVNGVEEEQLGNFRNNILTFSNQLRQHRITTFSLGQKTNWLALLVLILLAPLFLVFAGINGFALWTADYLVKKRVKDVMFTSTFRCFVMIFLYFFIWLILSIIAIAAFGVWGIVFAVFTPISAFLALFYKDAFDAEIAKWRLNLLKNREPELALALEQKQVDLLQQIENS